MFRGRTTSLHSNSYVSSGRVRLGVSERELLECDVAANTFLEPSTEDRGVALDIEPVREPEREGGLSILS